MQWCYEPETLLLFAGSYSSAQQKMEYDCI